MELVGASDADEGSATAWRKEQHWGGGELMTTQLSSVPPENKGLNEGLKSSP